RRLRTTCAMQSAQPTNRTVANMRMTASNACCKLETSNMGPLSFHRGARTCPGETIKDALTCVVHHHHKACQKGNNPPLVPVTWHLSTHSYGTKMPQSAI